MKKLAFTLAEVLITLTILGVVAAITIPSLVKTQSDKATVTKVKKAYATVQNAIEIANAENGPFYNWDWPNKVDKRDDERNGQYCLSMLEKYMHFSKKCLDDRTGECAPYYYYNLQGERYNDGSHINNYYKNTAILRDGSLFTCVPVQVTQFGIWERLLITLDVNGSKEPNRIGYDIFRFPINSDVYIKSTSPGECNAMKPYTRANDNNGFSCIIWILKHGNLDYKYRDVTNEW